MNARDSLPGLPEAYDGPAEKDAPLAPLTSFGLGGTADWLFTPRSHDEIGPLLALLRERGVAVTVLGEGSNVLVRDGGIRGAVIHVSSALGGVSWWGELAVCQAGLLTRRLAGRSLGAGRGGFEWAACIPGNLGGALRMNAGAYGGRIADCFEACRGWHGDGSPLALDKAEMEFGYRWTSLPVDALVTEITLRLPPLGTEELRAARERYREVAAKRIAFRPGRQRTAGSTFRNPEEHHAGRLIDSCGLKGMSRGGARVSSVHANFMEAFTEDATAADMEALMEAVAGEVESRTGVRLEREVKILGED